VPRPDRVPEGGEHRDEPQAVVVGGHEGPPWSGRGVARRSMSLPTAERRRPSFKGRGMRGIRMAPRRFSRRGAAPRGNHRRRSGLDPLAAVRRIHSGCCASCSSRSSREQHMSRGRSQAWRFRAATVSSCHAHWLRAGSSRPCPRPHQSHTRPTSAQRECERSGEVSSTEREKHWSLYLVATALARLRAVGRSCVTSGMLVEDRAHRTTVRHKSDLVVVRVRQASGCKPLQLLLQPQRGRSQGREAPSLRGQP
jgi:hypothetical protein